MAGAGPKFPLLLATGMPGYWIIAASILIGLSSGAESDALAILVGRYFGLLAYGKIYGHIFCASLIGISVFPYILGLGYDYFGNYTEVLYICAALFGISVHVVTASAIGAPGTSGGIKINATKVDNPNPALEI